ncbi:6-phosphogluconolactonase [Candidatus Peregrinibacteria bacterium RIFOXYB2_FULL_32_7]|nr:MAG: 6-phosphogluconolactonase [Candidatus Peregrinibacteria bacterium RIFOXYB2_FULL_32_7]
MVLKTFQNVPIFINETINFIVELSKTEKISRIGLSGGTTPKPIYEKLARNTEINFRNIEFYQVDERYIDKNHPDSNYKMIFESLIAPIAPKLKEFYYFDTTLEITDCLEKYEKILKQIPQQSFDLIILGIGKDGHTASLFPNSKMLAETEKLTAHTQTQKFAVKDRLTITFPMIMKSKNLLLLLQGKDKKKTLDAFLNSNKTTNEFPAKKLLEHNNLQVFYCEA